jgi:hypothetical protein
MTIKNKRKRRWKNKKHYPGLTNDIIQILFKECYYDNKKQWRE